MRRRSEADTCQAFPVIATRIQNSEKLALIECYTAVIPKFQILLIPAKQYAAMSKLIYDYRLREPTVYSSMNSKVSTVKVFCRVNSLAGVSRLHVCIFHT